MATRLNVKPPEDRDLLGRLESIETGEVDVAEARTMLRAVLAAHADEDGASEVFSSLRSWTGRMLRGSSSGDDLRSWHALFKAVAAQFRGPLSDYAVRVEVLADLIHERVGMAETRNAQDVLARRHVRPALAAIASARGGRLGRAELGGMLQLEQANLTRITTMMVDAGLASRIEEGRTVSFELSASGARHANARAASHVPQAPGSVPTNDPWLGPDPVEVALSDRGDVVPAAEEWSHYDVRNDVWEQKVAA